MTFTNWSTNWPTYWHTLADWIVRRPEPKFRPSDTRNTDTRCYVGTMAGFDLPKSDLKTLTTPPLHPPPPLPLHRPVVLIPRDSEKNLYLTNVRKSLWKRPGKYRDYGVRFYPFLYEYSETNGTHMDIRREAVRFSYIPIRKYIFIHSNILNSIKFIPSFVFVLIYFSMYFSGEKPVWKIEKWIV